MKKIIIGNLKMNLLSIVERERYFAAFKKEINGKKFKNSEMVICPPAVHLESFVKSLKNKSVFLGAQDMFWESNGSYTGEISPLMIKNLKVEYVIVGHSERRKYFGETNETVNLKIKSALKNGLMPIVCIGETKNEKDMELTMDVIISQLQEGLADIKRSQLEKIIFAYEPVWAVGSDVVPTSNEIMGAKLLIRKILTEKYGAKYVEKARILYGGSVKPNIAKQVCLDPGMDGVLVGRESLMPREFVKIAEIVDNS